MNSFNRGVCFSLLVIGSLAGATAPIETSLCPWKSKTDPQPLIGRQEGSEQSDYAFIHSSDVDKQDKVSEFVYSIQNTHSKNLLPAEWRNGKDEVVVRFERIAPGGCAANSLQATRDPIEDPKAVIKYGPVKQYSKKAPLYVAAPDDGPESISHDFQLSSRMTADLVDSGNKVSTVDFQLTSRVTAKTVFYVMSNTGKDNLRFAIPSLSSAWKDERRGVTVKQGWTSSENVGKSSVFVVSPGEHALFEIVTETGLEYADQAVKLEVRDAEGATLAEAQVLVHLPVFKR